MMGGWGMGKRGLDGCRAVKVRPVVWGESEVRGWAAVEMAHCPLAPVAKGLRQYSRVGVEERVVYPVGWTLLVRSGLGC
jgi:hypothetical protein